MPFLQQRGEIISSGSTREFPAENTGDLKLGYPQRRTKPVQRRQPIPKGIEKGALRGAPVNEGEISRLSPKSIRPLPKRRLMVFLAEPQIFPSIKRQRSIRRIQGQCPLSRGGKVLQFVELEDKMIRLREIGVRSQVAVSLSEQTVPVTPQFLKEMTYSWVMISKMLGSRFVSQPFELRMALGGNAQHIGDKRDDTDFKPHGKFEVEGKRLL